MLYRLYTVVLIEVKKYNNKSNKAFIYTDDILLIYK